MRDFRNNNQISRIPEGCINKFPVVLSSTMAAEESEVQRAVTAIENELNTTAKYNEESGNWRFYVKEDSRRNWVPLFLSWLVAPLGIALNVGMLGLLGTALLLTVTAIGERT